MCGIYGQNFPISTRQEEILIQQLRHRGPDEQRVKHYEKVSFFHSRLAIIDAAAGRQPMERGDFVMVFNGEIYNHQELRQQFSLKCESRSDTETLLALFEKLGTEMLRHLDGMFAFAIYNKKLQTLLLARDRMGEKPLYYHTWDNGIAFASELNTLAALFPLEVPQDGLQEFLVKGWVGPVKTIYKNVYSLTQGNVLTCSLHDGCTQITTTPWWQPAERMKQLSKSSFEETKTATVEALRLSVKRRMEMSDLPVGCFLSGGIDSGLVTAMAAANTSKLHTFTFSFEGAYDESPVANTVAAHFNTKHTSISVGYDRLADDIGKILLSFGEPFSDESAVPSYYVAQEARKQVAVVLNGDGGDEMFGGYRRYVPQGWPKVLRKLLSGMAGITKALPEPASKMSAYNYLYRFLRTLQGSDAQRYLASSTDLFWDDAGGNLWSEKDGSMEWLNGIMNNHQLSDLKKMLLSDYEGLLPQVLLRKIDIATMQHSLESRTVFFAPELLAVSVSLPDKYVVGLNATKPMLRSIASDLLPGSIHALPKRGFEPPLNQWLSGQLSEMVNDYLQTGTPAIASVIQPAKIDYLFDKHCSIAPDRKAKLIYSAFALEYWCRHKTSCLVHSNNS